MSDPITFYQRAGRLPLAIVVACALASALPASAQLAPAGPATVATAFTPGWALPLVLETIRGARSTIFVAAYTFTSKPIATELLEASKRGVKVFVLADATEASKAYSAVRFLANEKVPVRVNGRYAIQHNKFMVIDGTIVQTGSFNYTSSAAQRNAENVIVVRNAPAIAAQYDAEWRRLWSEGSELAPSY
ncbi:phospholipase D family protein [Variovorax robiniae]|uniref:phospholipase D n=1 Tax=Variovorax robiniae TaxID=1836199 RepID=A0ABU8XJ73_9BURK